MTQPNPAQLPDHGSFVGAFRECGATPRPRVFEGLLARYAEPHRAYHTAQHLGEAFDILETVRDRVARWSEVVVALWFHDAIYDTRRHDNEERSADWARDELLAGGAAADAAARVHALIVATKHDRVPDGNDARLLVDADLAILASPTERFAEYEQQIRREYAWVPEPDFHSARGRFLRAMLDRPVIFGDEHLRARFEAAARRNLTESLMRLANVEP